MPTASLIIVVDVAASGMSTIGNNVTANWNVSAIVNNLPTINWNVLTKINVLSDEQWNILTKVFNTSNEQWNVTGTAFNTSNEQWNVRSTVFNLSNEQWNTLSYLTTIGNNSDEQWNVLTTTNVLNNIYWNVNTKTFNLVQSNWNLNNPVFNLVNTQWNTKAGVIGTMFMFIDADTTPISNNIDLYLNSTTNNSINSGIDLYTSGQLGTYNSSLNLTIFNNSLAPLNTSMALYLSGMGNPIGKSLDLILNNVMIDNSLNMFIQGDGLNDSLYPANGALNLFISRNEAISLDLFLANSSGVNNSMNLYVAGGTVSTGTQDLLIPYTKDTLNTNIPLYVNGYK